MSEPVYSSNSYVTLRKAAIAGRGVAVLPIRLVGDELADGTLVTVLPECEVPDRPLYALHSPGTVRRAGELLPNARVEIVTDAPHSMYWERPALFNDAIRRFLKEVAAS
jgi:DNA-binding transcriptional LysR family regulator